MEKGNAAQFKNKTLEEIDIDMNEIESVLEEDDKMEISNTSSTLGMYHLIISQLKNIFICT